MGWVTTSPWKPIKNSGQSAALTSAANVQFANAVGPATQAVQISCIGSNCLVRIDKAGAAASATGDVLVKTTDGPVVLGCDPGDTVSAWGLGTGTVYLCEMTH